MNDSVFYSPPVIAALATLLAFVVAALALGIARSRYEDVRAALAALGAMPWREFAHHVAGVLAQRGLRQDELDRRANEQGFDIRMTRGTARYLVRCSQVGSIGLGPAPVRDFAAAVRQHGAEGGILVTTAGVDAAARKAAGEAGIELLSGYQLWRQLRPLLPVDVVADIQAAARARRARKALLALLIAAAAGGAAFMAAVSLGRGGDAQTAAPAPGRPAAPKPAAGPAAGPDAGPSAEGPASRPARQPPAPTPTPPPEAARTDQAPAGPAAAAGTQPDAPPLPPQMPDPTLTEAELAARRAEVERAVRRVPGVRRADWSARSTIVLTVPVTDDGSFPEHTITAVCAALVRFEELRYTRLQVQPEAAGDATPAWVRWRQCR